MRYSLSLPRPSGRADPAEIDGYLNLARRAEEIGFHACATTDHPFPKTLASGVGHSAHDPFVLLTHIAAATSALRLHFNLIVLPYRSPFVTARMLATLDLVSRGRVIAGVGAGYLKDEFAAVGADYANRGALLEEGIEAMKAAWTGEPVTMHGTLLPDANANVMRPTPFAKPHPRMWRGGNSLKAMEHAAIKCDGWSPFEITADLSRDTATRSLSIQNLPPRVQMFRQMAADAGRDDLEVCFVRPSASWLADDSQASEELQFLHEGDVDWLVVQASGQSAAERMARLERFAQLACSTSPL